MDGSETTDAAPQAPPAPLKPPADPTPTPPPAPEAESEPKADPGTYEDDKFSRDQLIRHARELCGAESYIVRVALQHAGGQDFFTKEEAQAAVKELLEAPAGDEAELEEAKE